MGCSACASVKQHEGSMCGADSTCTQGFCSSDPIDHDEPTSLDGFQAIDTWGKAAAWRLASQSTPKCERQSCHKTKATFRWLWPAACPACCLWHNVPDEASRVPRPQPFSFRFLPFIAGITTRQPPQGQSGPHFPDLVSRQQVCQLPDD